MFTYSILEFIAYLLNKMGFTAKLFIHHLIQPSIIKCAEGVVSLTQ